MRLICRLVFLAAFGSALYAQVAGTISGYVASSVVYTLNGSNPGNVDSVALSLDSAPLSGSTMKIKLVSSGSTWYSCTNSGANLTCATTSPQATVSASDELRLLVVQ